MDNRTIEDYKRQGFSRRSGFGSKPALLVVDFINGFTDPSSPLGGDYTRELEVTNRLLAGFRGAGLPIIFTTIAYEPHFRDAGVFIKKVPTLSILLKGSPMAEVDSRIRPLPGEYVLEKKMPSSFFNTRLDTYLQSLGVDTVVMAGCTTSGCIRASAIDAMQYGFITVVVADAVGDRAQGPHEANLFDIDAKYGDVMPAQEALDHLQRLSTTGGIASSVHQEFQQWWNQGSPGRLS